LLLLRFQNLRIRAAVCLPPGAKVPRGRDVVQSQAPTVLCRRASRNVTLEESQLDQVRFLVRAGTATSVWGFVQHAVAVALEDVARWGAMLAEALPQTGRPLSDDEPAWADEGLGSPARSAA